MIAMMLAMGQATQAAIVPPPVPTLVLSLRHERRQVLGDDPRRAPSGTSLDRRFAERGYVLIVAEKARIAVDEEILRRMPERVAGEFAQHFAERGFETTSVADLPPRVRDRVVDSIKTYLPGIDTETALTSRVSVRPVGNAWLRRPEGDRGRPLIIPVPPSALPPRPESPTSEPARSSEPTKSAPEPRPTLKVFATDREEPEDVLALWVRVQPSYEAFLKEQAERAGALWKPLALSAGRWAAKELGLSPGQRSVVAGLSPSARELIERSARVKPGALDDATVSIGRGDLELSFSIPGQGTTAMPLSFLSERPRDAAGR